MRISVVVAASVALGLSLSLVAVAQQAQEASMETGVVWTVDQGEWAPLPDIFPPGGQMKIVNGDPGEGAADFYFKFPAGYGVPWHFHTPVERVFADRGTMEFEMRDGTKKSISEGGYIYFPSKAPHKATCTSETDCFFYLASNGIFDIHVVDPETWTVSESWSAAETE